jgi:dTDP-4-amino-4,6-dideoxygalactose transaminase
MEDRDQRLTAENTEYAENRLSPSQRKRLFLSPPHIGSAERDFVHEAFASNYIAPIGPMVDAFEKEFAAYTSIPHCLALASGTAAMHLALRELGVGPGDEVLASTLTFIGSVSPATFLGASVAFIDSDEQTWNMDPALLADELAECARRGKLPKAVIPTALYRQCCDLPRLREICARYQVPMVSDSAEAMGSRYQEPDENREQKAEYRIALPGKATGVPELNPISTFCFPLSALKHAGYGAKAAVFSFNGNKILTTSGGGMLASHDEPLIEHARKLSQQARDPAPHYEHSEIGYNYRMSNILAAIGRGQLRVLDERVAAKRRIFEQYRQLLADLPGISFMPEPPSSRCNRWLTVTLIDGAEFGSTPEQVRLALEAENIESRPIWKPMHLQPVFSACRVRSAECGVESGRQAVARRSGKSISEDLFARGLSLPSGTAMGEGDVERVAKIIRGCSSEGRSLKSELRDCRPRTTDRRP